MTRQKPPQKAKQRDVLAPKAAMAAAIGETRDLPDRGVSESVFLRGCQDLSALLDPRLRRPENPPS